MKIIWRGKLNKISTVSTVEIPKDSAEFLKPKRTFEYYIAVIPIAVFFLFCAYIKSHFIAKVRMNLLGEIIGLLLAILLISIHELLHAICFPPEAIVEIYYNKYGLGTMSNSPISKKRFIIISILPVFVLGFIPLILWTFIPIQNITLNSICCFSAAGSLGGGTVDLFSAVNTLINVPNGMMIKTIGSKAYYYKA